jgi:hypothetical protein
MIRVDHHRHSQPRSAWTNAARVVLHNVTCGGAEGRNDLNTRLFERLVLEHNNSFESHQPGLTERVNFGLGAGVERRHTKSIPIPETFAEVTRILGQDFRVQLVARTTNTPSTGIGDSRIRGNASPDMATRYRPAPACPGRDSNPHGPFGPEGFQPGNCRSTSAGACRIVPLKLAEQDSATVIGPARWHHKANRRDLFRDYFSKCADLEPAPKRHTSSMLVPAGGHAAGSTASLSSAAMGTSKRAPPSSMVRCRDPPSAAT